MRPGNASRNTCWIAQMGSVVYRMREWGSHCSCSSLKSPNHMSSAGLTWVWYLGAPLHHEWIDHDTIMTISKFDKLCKHLQSINHIHRKTSDYQPVSRSNIFLQSLHGRFQWKDSQQLGCVASAWCLVELPCRRRLVFSFESSSGLNWTEQVCFFPRKIKKALQDVTSYYFFSQKSLFFREFWLCELATNQPSRSSCQAGVHSNCSGEHRQ